MLIFGGVCRRRRAAAARLLPPTFGTPALLIGCRCCHHDFKLRPPMLCFTVALASLFYAHCLCHYVAEVEGQGVQGVWLALLLDIFLMVPGVLK